MIGKGRKLPVIPLCLAGFFVGLMVRFFGKENLSFLGETNLYHLKNELPDCRELVWYIGKIRFEAVFFLSLAATTYLQPFVSAGLVIWFGISAGIFAETAVTGYGIKGILLIVAGMFPQYLIYLPMYYLLVRWCEKIYSGIYYKQEFSGAKSVAEMILILAGITVGIWMECFWNPGIFQGLLRVF